MSGWKPAIFINGPLLPEEKIVSFPLIFSCVALGTSVKWENFNVDFILVIVFLSFSFT